MRSAPRPSAALKIALLAIVGFMVLYPLGMVLFGSFWSSTPGAPGHLTLAGYAKAYGSAHTYVVLGNTLFLAVVRTLIAVTIAIILAWVIARTNVPGKDVLELGMYFLFFLPLLPRIIGWILLLSPRTGLINLLLRKLLPFHPPAIDVFSYGGIIWVGVLTWVPILYIFVVPAFKSMDASLEDAARMSGAGIFSTIRHVNLPLLSPAILATTALGFVGMVGSFMVEAMLGLRANIPVFSTQIFAYTVQAMDPEYPPAMALSVTMLAITFAVVALQWKLLASGRFTTVTGKGFRSRPIDLGGWRWPTFAAVTLLLAVSLLLPLAVLVWVSFTKVPGVFMPDMYTLRYYRQALVDTTLWTAVKNTVVMGLAVASIGMVVCAMISYVVVKTKFAARRLLDVISWIPWAVPGIVLSMGFLWAALFFPFRVNLYGTLTLMIVCLIIKGLPLGTRSMSSTMVQISDELEESARVHGASWTQTFVRVMAPLLANGLAAGWILMFAFAVKDLEAVILLFNASSTVMSTQIFSWWLEGNFQAAAILGLLEALLITAFFIASQMLSRRMTVQAAY